MLQQVGLSIYQSKCVRISHGSGDPPIFTSGGPRATLRTPGNSRTASPSYLRRFKNGNPPGELLTLTLLTLRVVSLPDFFRRCSVRGSGDLQTRCEGARAAGRTHP